MYKIAKKARDFGLYRSLSQLTNETRGIFSQLTGRETEELFKNNDATKMRTFEEEFIYGSKIFLELLDTLPDELNKEKAIIYIPIKSKVKFIKGTKNSFSSSHLIAKNNNQFYGINILNEDFIAFLLD
ncbi:hypothetical protein [Enterococcus sp. AZ194]|uniref:hypothetical protein n=1 Tax=Enterococcus sp. AZ194 TaxID=2774629 RepID=UPI003F68746B